MEGSAMSGSGTPAFPSHRPAVMGRQGMVSSAHYLASMAGLRVMMDGGNAVDAAVAVAAALNVVEPYMSGLGGDGLMAITLPGAPAPIILDYSGGAPLEASLATITEQRMTQGPAALLVPGAPGGWLAALGRYGSLPAQRVFADAIRLAEDGAPVSFRNVEFIGIGASQIAPYENSAATFMPGGEIPRAGSILKQPKLARTLRRLAEGGAAEFYSGSLGREVVGAVRAAGGVLSDVDLANFQVEWQAPLSVDFHGWQVFAPPPPCAGLQYLQTLLLVAGDDLVALSHNSAGYIHLLIEAIKLAEADRMEYTQRPIDHAGLLDPEYVRQRREQIDPGSAAYGPGERWNSPESRDPAAVQPGEPRITRRAHEHTTHFAAADASGMAVNVTQSLGNPFGCGFMAGDTGLMLNNFLHWTDHDPESPNALAGGKKMENCMAPPQVYRDGRFVMTMGTPGSWGIPQTQTQAILNVIAHGMNVQEAIEQPRFRHIAGREIAVESRVPASVTDDLSALGHIVTRVPDWSWLVGGMHGIYRDPQSGVLMGGADPRRDGYAVGW
jgi:gamma-glutamyltranspeptidase/glutathione hydrolase